MFVFCIEYGYNRQVYNMLVFPSQKKQFKSIKKNNIKCSSVTVVKMIPLFPPHDLARSLFVHWFMHQLLMAIVLQTNKENALNILV